MTKWTGRYCKTHPDIELVPVNDNGTVTERCVLCDMEQSNTSEEK